MANINTIEAKEQRERIASMFRSAALILLLAALVLPFFAFVINSFAYRWFYPQLIPNEWSLDAWNSVLDDDLFKALYNSITIAVSVTIVSVIIGIPASRAMGLYTFRGKRIVEFLILAPTIVPGIAVAMGLNINFLRWGLAGEPFGVGLVHLVPVMPYVVLTLSGVFANYNPEFEQQARTLGAGPIRTFWYVTLPAIFPGLVVASLFAFLVSWSQYILTFLIGQGRVVTMPVLLFTTIPGGRNPNIAAMSLVFIAPAVLILMLSSRYLSGESNTVGGFGQV
jgi:putative spermidine/putrescine transport system permease protein